MKAFNRALLALAVLLISGSAMLLLATVSSAGQAIDLSAPLLPEHMPQVLL
ncbi:MAG TPA: hypothetical protein VGC20_14855 [bacterium]|jgi:hypothetical protein